MPRSPFQFGTVSLFTTTLIAAVGSAALWSWPGVLGAVGLIAITLPVAASWAIGMWYGSGFKQAFCIGAFAPISFTCVEGFFFALWLMSRPQRPPSEYYDALKYLCALGWAAAIVCGCFSCLVLWSIRRSSARG